jgi:hypothetical protein
VERDDDILGLVHATVSFLARRRCRAAGDHTRLRPRGQSGRRAQVRAACHQRLDTPAELLHADNEIIERQHDAFVPGTDAASSSIRATEA